MRPFRFSAAEGVPEVVVTSAMVNVLSRMQGAEDADYLEEAELTYERGAGWWLGSSQTNGRVCMMLVRACALRADSGNRVGQFERYTLNETGRKILALAHQPPLTPTGDKT